MKASDCGLSVHVVDVGNDDPRTREAIPAASFSWLRRNDPAQVDYFVGDFDAQSVVDVRVGAQLTPPRQFITKDVDELAPFRSDSFFPMRSLALGGLGAGWGAGAVSFSDDELGRIGLPASEMASCYDEVAANIGVSGSPEDDIADEMLRFRPVQPPQPLDSNAETLFRTYRARREALRAAGLTLGRSPIAMLSERLGDGEDAREPNPLEDMDFYSDRTRSVYRPRYTIEALSRRPSFCYRDRLFAKRFRQTEDGVELVCRDLRTGADVTLRARRLVLAAGAIASTRLALASLDLYDRPVPLLANPYLYMPCVNLPMLGRRSADRRHSMTQLGALFTSSAHPDEKLYLSFYSYRSLLLYKLIKEMPLPTGAGLLAARLLLSSLTVVGVNFPERRSSEKWMALRRGDGERPDEMTAHYRDSEAELRTRRDVVRTFTRALRPLRLIPLRTIDPGNGSSIHYAGGLTITDDTRDPLGTAQNGQLHAMPYVYVADSANWKFIPSKGPTMTMMANARRVAAHLAATLGVRSA